MSLATKAVTVAATVPESQSSTSMGVAAAEPSKEMPHSMIVRPFPLPFSCRRVLMLVPVVTFTGAAAPAEAPLLTR